MSTEALDSAACLELPHDLVILVQGQQERTGLAAPLDVIRLALHYLEEQAPADGSAASVGPAYDLAELHTAHAALILSRADRDFVIQLSSRQRALSHPEVIMQITAEAIGRKLGVARAGFYRVHDHTLDFGACWTDASVSPLDGHMALVEFGEGFAAIERQGETIVTENCYTDPAVNGERFAAINAIAMIGVPLVRGRKWVAGLYLHHPEPRHWTATEIALAEEVAELGWDAVERASANRALRDRIGQQTQQLSDAANELKAEAGRADGAESQIRQLQKMEAVGQLTGGIAHDFNNMLAVIIGGLGLMQRRLERGDTNIGKYVDAAMDGATRAAALTQRLLAFSRQQPLSPQPLDANRMISGMTELLTRSLGETVGIETVLTAGLWTMQADASQLENALLNLAVNARDAMPEGGKLTIETGNTHVDRDYAQQNEVPEGQYVMLAVSDTGSGMAPDILARVFDPFFTTKPQGKGTGLGLSQVFGFVRQSGGVIKLYSEPGHGTTVKIYLPRHYGEALPLEMRAAPEQVRGGDPREIILVVEDEERVRDHNVEALRELGYTVVHASGGEEALALLDDGQAISLLFTDIVMPGMTGRQLADEALKRLPGLKVIYTTGYTRNAVVHNGVLDPGTNFLPKPHGIDQLAALVRGVLDA